VIGLFFLIVWLIGIPVSVRPFAKWCYRLTPTRKTTSEYAQGRVWEAQDGSQVMIAGLRSNGYLIIQRLDRDAEISSVTPSQLVAAFAPTHEVLDLEVAEML
jgi:hypothetical protein